MEREIAAQAEAARKEIAELTALLEGYDKALEEVRITRKTLLEMPDPPTPVPPTPTPTPTLPDHPAYQQIMAVFSAAAPPLHAWAVAVDSPLHARALCEAMDLEIAPNNINNVRPKLKRLADRGILIEPEPEPEPEQSLFTQPRPTEGVDEGRPSRGREDDGRSCVVLAVADGEVGGAGGVVHFEAVTAGAAAEGGLVPAGQVRGVLK
ncbi:hypothetical protein SALBM135S_00801 [Streptomyces alboniger]